MLNKMKKREILYYFGALLLSNLCYLTAGYQQMRLQDYLCTETNQQRHEPPVLDLNARDDSAAAIIEQTWNSTLPDSNSYQANRLAYDCQFSVQTERLPPRDVYIVVRRLQLRSDNVAGCRDYIEFSGGKRPPSGRICQQVVPSGRLVFDRRGRDFNVRIHIDTRHLIEEPLQLALVLTTHGECEQPGDLRCDPRDPWSCVSRRYVRDNITNCPYTYRDEDPCLCNVTWNY